MVAPAANAVCWGAMQSFKREHPLAAKPDHDAACLAFLFRGRDLLVGRDPWRVPIQSFSSLESEPRIDGLRRLGELDGVPCFAGWWSGAEMPPGVEPQELRQLYAVLDESTKQIAGLAMHLLHWDRTHAFCGVCGGPMEIAAEEMARSCSMCHQLVYPRIAPSIIVAVTRGDELLLARGTRFAIPMYSVLAGFVEPGETLEECVHREVREEVGIEVGDLQYFGSQPWPFPDSLMIGFTARYQSGELTPDAREIVEAGWFRREAMPRVPGQHSISGRLIDWFVRSEHARDPSARA